MSLIINANFIFPAETRAMSRQSEEVLLIVNAVKNKKLDGMLYMMGERMAWMQSSKNTFTYSHPYADIKGTKDSCPLLFAYA